MARRNVQSRVARYRGLVSIQIVELSPVAGQHIDILLYDNLQVMFNETSDTVIDGDLAQVALQTYMFRAYDDTLNIDAGNIVIYDSDRYKIISVVAKSAPLTQLLITATKIEV